MANYGEVRHCPSVMLKSGERATIEATTTLWIVALFPYCDDPKRERSRKVGDGIIPRLYRQGLLCVFLRDEGCSYRELAELLNRDLAYVHRLETRTRALLADRTTVEPVPGTDGNREPGTWRDLLSPRELAIYDRSGGTVAAAEYDHRRARTGHDWERFCDITD